MIIWFGRKWYITNGGGAGTEESKRGKKGFSFYDGPTVALEGVILAAARIEFRVPPVLLFLIPVRGLSFLH